MPHKQYYHRPTVLKDLALMLIFNVAMFIIFQYVDLLEAVYQFSRQHEDIELDEIIPLTSTIALSLLVFSYRRIRELGFMAQTLEQLSLNDPLTNLPNRRAGQIKLISWCDKAEKDNRGFSVFQIDLDDFKTVNDFYGQSVGDEALKLVAQLLKNHLSSSTMLCRWLDDNFLVVLPNSVEQPPFDMAKELQQVINGQVMPSTLALTCSIGFTLWQKEATVEQLFHQAEDALMQAKHEGKSSIKGA